MAEKAESEWNCATCTFANHPDLPSCEMCNSARPQPTSPSLHSPAPDFSSQSFSMSRVVGTSDDVVSSGTNPFDIFHVHELDEIYRETDSDDDGDGDDDDANGDNHLQQHIYANSASSSSVSPSTSYTLASLPNTAVPVHHESPAPVAAGAVPNTPHLSAQPLPSKKSSLAPQVLHCLR